ncbi:hypothetical protein [Rhizobium leguminosarum]|uniref:hypothetical protein n=1 Tax=Rhizobium leguminosarum TaxID=384 RepID=UPI003F9A883B
MTEIREEIEGNFSRDPLFEPLQRMVAFLEKADPGELRLLTINQLSEVSGVGRGDGQLIRLVSILASPSLPLLKMCFLYSNGEEEFELSDEEVADARATGVFYDPITGLKDEDYESHILPYFKATPGFLGVRS